METVVVDDRPRWDRRLMNAAVPSHFESHRDSELLDYERPAEVTSRATGCTVTHGDATVNMGTCTNI
ncbi:hypothetical protein P8C59_003873 [Phyllachora maydis]|uniref:Uncharacterized protein n=1 Tax=Phyllachora maydis TaxID=1825666 RepID=A0AAD9I2B1_9PEZI|nr:hypothetical protein P8C59_003873 [Phyllachora maydis]